jgi:hypothetical protein
MESMMNNQQQLRQQSIDESNDQYQYTFTPNQLENLKKSV